MAQKIPERLEHIEPLPRNPWGKVLDRVRSRWASTTPAVVV